VGKIEHEAYRRAQLFIPLLHDILEWMDSQKEIEGFENDKDIDLEAKA